MKLCRKEETLSAEFQKKKKAYLPSC